MGVGGISRNSRYFVTRTILELDVCLEAHGILCGTYIWESEVCLDARGTLLYLHLGLEIHLDTRGTFGIRVSELEVRLDTRGTLRRICLEIRGVSRCS